MRVRSELQLRFVNERSGAGRPAGTAEKGQPPRRSSGRAGHTMWLGPHKKGAKSRMPRDGRARALCRARARAIAKVRHVPRNVSQINYQHFGIRGGILRRPDRRRRAVPDERIRLDMARDMYIPYRRHKHKRRSTPRSPTSLSRSRGNALLCPLKGKSSVRVSIRVYSLDSRLHRARA